MFLRVRDTHNVPFFRIVLCLMPLQITMFWGFPCPGPGEGLVLKVALEAELQSRLCLEHEMSSEQRGQTTGKSTKICGKSRGRARQDSRMPVAGAGAGGGAGLSGHAAMKTLSPQEPGCHPGSQPRTEPHRTHEAAAALTAELQLQTCHIGVML